MNYFCYLLAAFWGLLLALLLQFTGWGQFLAYRRTWITVVVGVGVDLLIVLLLLYTLPDLSDPLKIWLHLVVVISLSSIGVIGRGVYLEYSETKQEMERLKGQHNGR